MTHLIDLQFILPVMTMFCLNKATSPPGPPLHLSVVSDVNNIGVQWEPPAETYGNIRNYIVSWAVLPNFTDFTRIIGGDATMSNISAHRYVGRLFRIRVRAENEGGIGPYTSPKYIRIECGNDYSLFPKTNVTITSPAFQAGYQLQPGVICTWTFKTLDTYSLDIFFDELNLSGSKSSNDCLDSYIDISGIGRLCNKSHKDQHIRTDLQTFKVILKTGRQSGGRGFRITVKSVVLLPGMPTNITLRTTDRAIIITWLPPREKTLSITAYRIQYGVIAQNNHFLITVGQNMRYFAINTNKFEGKLMELYLSAVIGMEEGKLSDTYFARAPCRRHIHLNGASSINITSPGYPRAYPSSIICTWYITSERNVTSSVTFVDFRLEDTIFCNSDYVTFSFNENTEHECSRKQLPKTIETHVQNFTIKFVTDGKNEFAGFCLQIKTKVVSAKNEISTTESAATKTKFMDDSSRKFKSSTDLTSSAFTLMTSSITERYISSPATTSVKVTEDIHTAHPSETVFTRRNISRHFAQNKTSISTMPTSAHAWSMNVTLSTQEIASYGPGETVQYASNSSSVYGAWPLQSNSSISGSTSGATSKGKGSEDDNDKNIVLAVILSLVFCGAILAVSTCYVRCRRRHEQMKINVETAGKYRVTNIELHDILRNPTRTVSQISNYRARVAENNGETVFARRHLETIPEYPEDCLWNKKNKNKSERKRCNSFPLCFSARRRKIHKQIHNTLTSFAFIEDKQALETTLKRKYCLRRTNSL